jgi:AraC family transcriptional regulator
LLIIAGQMGITMSSLPSHLDDIDRHAAAAFATALSRQHQVTSLLVHAMALIERDEQSAVAFVRKASAIAERNGTDPAPMPQPHRGGLAPWQVDRVKRHVDGALAKRIGLVELARLSRLSTSYFAAAFRVSFGTSPHDYICRRRVERAKELMTATESPLCEIALDCGFADQSHLSRVFRRMTGHTPAAWRRDTRVA